MNAATNQKDPSVWMILAMAQTYFWFFGIPAICHRYWDSIFGSMSTMKANFVLGVVAVPGLFILFSLLMLPIYYIQHPFLEQYKIQPSCPWPWLVDENNSEKVRRDFWALSKRSVKLTFINVFCILPVLIAIQVYVNEKLGISDPHEFDTSPEFWPPRTFQTLQDIISLTVVHELGFYVTHRLMHSYPFLYKYHKVHHEYKTNTVLASMHNHPIDFILSIGGPGLLAKSLMRTHSITSFQSLLWILYSNVDDHCGYSFPWSPVRWFPFSATTDEHEFHHAKNLGCFGSKLTIWNTIFGGYDTYSKHKWKSK